MPTHLLEQTLNRITLMPLNEAEGDTPSPSRRVSASGIRAGSINKNMRLYTVEATQMAVMKAQQRLAQGQYIFGESAHPKKNEDASLRNVSINWDKIDFDGQQVLLEGAITKNEAGRDLLALLQDGIMPCISQRARGDTEFIKEGEVTIEKVTRFEILAYDAVVFPGDETSGITKLESEQMTMANQPITSETTPPPLTLAELKEKHGDAVAQLLHEERQKQLAEAEAQANEQAKIQAKLDELALQVRLAAGLPEEANLQEALKQQATKLKQIQEAELKAQIDTAITEAADKLKYAPDVKAKFMESVKRLEPHSLEEASRFIAATQIDYDARMAEVALKAQGYVPQKGAVVSVRDVLENELGIPEFARAAFELTESLNQVQGLTMFNPKKPRNLNEAYAVKVLARYDELNRHKLMAESRLWQEAEQSADLSLHASLGRTILAFALPRLVATSIFDVDMMEASPSKIFYEKYVAESGTNVTVNNEAVVTSLDVYVPLAGGVINFGSVVVQNSGNSVTYVEGTDFLINYDEGEIMTITGGAIANSATVHVDYTYTKLRNGEMNAIQRAKGTLGSEVIEAAAYRLATEISDEAITFSRSQLGWDAVNRTLAMLANEVMQKIDGKLFAKGITAALGVVNNSGGTYASASAPIVDLVKMIGYARVKVANRLYVPDSIVLSLTNSDRLANWDGFTQAGARPDADLNTNGYVGRLKGLPVFESTEMKDAYVLVCNKQLVMHRVLTPLEFKGPFPSYSNGQLVAAEQYFTQEYSGTKSPIKEKGAYVKIE